MTTHTHCALEPSVGECAGIRVVPQPVPWPALTKGECLLLALALHRLARRNAAQSGGHEEDTDR
jgi:hypothetical protein